MVNAPQVVFVTGASSGIGAAAARELAARGHRVIATMRNPKRDVGLSDAPWSHEQPIMLVVRASAGLDLLGQSRGQFPSLHEHRLECVGLRQRRGEA